MPKYDSYRVVQAVTPNDSTVYDPPFEGVLVNGTGDLAVVDAAGNTVTITSVVAGQILPIMISKIMNTNTDATEIFGLRY